MKSRLRTMLPVAALAVAIALISYLALAKKSSPEPQSKLTPAASPTPHPLSIAGLRGRTYPGGPLTVSAELNGAAGLRDQLVTWPSDGLAQYARLVRPAGEPPAGGWPVIVLLHGYVDPASWESTGADYITIMNTLAGAGFAVLRPDYRGHGQSQGTPAGGHFAPDYTYDALNLLASIKTFPGVNPARVGLIGHSLGGHVALRSMVVSDQIRATAMMAGVTGTFEDIFFNWPRPPIMNDRPRTLVQGARTRLIEQYGDPRQNPAFWSAASAVNFVAAVRGPVQINHSVGDSNVPVAFADRLEANLRAAGKTVEVNKYPGDDHQFTASRAALMTNLIRFFTQNLS